MIRVTLFKREYRQTGFSIEGIFQLVKDCLQNRVHIDEDHVDPSISRFQNILRVKKVSLKNPINHITGDVYFLALGFSRKRKTVLTIHDFGHVDKLKNTPVRQFLFKQLWYDLPLKRADIVTVVSEYTRDELIRRFNFPESKIRIIYNPIKPIFKYAHKELVNERIKILQIGTGVHKNLSNLVEAVKGLNCHLDIIAWPSDEDQQKLEQYNISFSIYKGLSDEEVYQKYVECDVLFFASFYEGFGMPLIEAQAIGRPVITSNLGAMKEIAHDTAIMVDPHSPADIRAAIQKLSADHSYYFKMVRLGLENTRQFEPEKISNDYLEVYKELSVSKRKLTALSIHPTHYSDYLFHELTKAGINVEVFYTRQLLPEYPWKNRLDYTFNQQFCKYTFGIDWSLLKDVIANKNSTYLVYGWDTFNKNLILLLLALTNRRYFVFTDTFQGHVKRKRLKHFVRAAWLKFVFSNAEKILTTGQIGVDRLKSFYNSSKIINFPFTTDINYFNSIPDFSNFSGNKIIFSSGRLLNSHKGYDVAINALARIKEKGFKFTYYIAGTGPDKGTVEELIHKLGLQNDIVLLGWQELDSLKKYYSNSHVFLHASHFDPFPNCIMEAMASRLVVVSSDVAGSAVDRISEGNNGFLFKNNQVESLTEVLLKVFAMDSKELEHISTEARKTAEQWNVNYNVEIIKDIV